MKTAMEMWDTAEKAVEEMPADIRIEFAESIEKTVSQKDLLQGKIEAAITALQETWLNFPRDWKRGDLQNACQQARNIWRMLDAIANIEKGDRYDSARLKAEKILVDGYKFAKITIDGIHMVVDGGGAVSEDPGIPF